MNERSPESRGPHRSGIGFPLFVFILVFCSLMCLVLSLLPSAKISRSLENTFFALAKREEGILFPLGLLQEGNLSLSGEGEGFTYNATADGTLSASVFQGEKDLLLYAEGGKVTLGSKLLSETDLTFSRSTAFAEVWDSAVDPHRLTSEDRALLLAFLSLSDPALFEWEPITAPAGKVLSPADGKISSEKGEYRHGNESVSLQNYTCTYSSKKLLKALDEFAKSGADAAVQNAVCSKQSLLSALGGRSFTSADAEITSLFLSGKGEAFHHLKTLCSAEGANLSVTYGIKRGDVILVSADFTSGEILFHLEIFFGEKVKDGILSVALSLKKGEESVLEAHVDHRVAEDSRTAYVREIDYSLSDPQGVFLSSDSGPISGKIRYSWGKQKGDVGLRIITPEGQIGFGGMVEEYKREKLLRLRISRIEVDRVNRLKGDLTLTLSKKPSEHNALSPAEPPLSQEEKEALSNSFFSQYEAISGGTA